MVEKLLASIVMLACAVLLVRLVLPPAARARLDRAGRLIAWRLRAAFDALRRLPQRRAIRREAERRADEAIRRARGGGVERDGNVYKPKSFGDKRNLH